MTSNLSFEEYSVGGKWRYNNGTLLKYLDLQRTSHAILVFLTKEPDYYIGFFPLLRQGSVRTVQTVFEIWILGTKGLGTETGKNLPRFVFSKIFEKRLFQQFWSSDFLGSIFRTKKSLFELFGNVRPGEKQDDTIFLLKSIFFKGNKMPLAYFESKGWSRLESFPACWFWVLLYFFENANYSID